MRTGAPARGEPGTSSPLYQINVVPAGAAKPSAVAKVPSGPTAIRRGSVEGDPAKKSFDAIEAEVAARAPLAFACRALSRAPASASAVSAGVAPIRNTVVEVGSASAV